MKTDTLNIEGMSCQHCVSSILDAALTLEGVTEADVQLDGKFAKVSYDENKTDLSKIKEAIEEQGFYCKYDNILSLG